MKLHSDGLAATNNGGRAPSDEAVDEGKDSGEISRRYVVAASVDALFGQLVDQDLHTTSLLHQNLVVETENNSVIVNLIEQFIKSGVQVDNDIFSKYIYILTLFST